MNFPICSEKLEYSGKYQTNFLAFFHCFEIQIGELPPGFADAWVAAGSKAMFRFTWDALLNDNITAGKARCRFDRIIYKRYIETFSYHRR